MLPSTGKNSSAAAVLLMTEDLDEAIALADRILVMYEGRIAGEVPRGHADITEIGLLMGGGRPDEGTGGEADAEDQRIPDHARTGDLAGKAALAGQDFVVGLGEMAAPGQRQAVAMDVGGLVRRGHEGDHDGRHHDEDAEHEDEMIEKADAVHGGSPSQL